MSFFLLLPRCVVHLAFLSQQSHTPTVGKVWPPQPVVFPDFSNPAAADWWRVNIAEWFQQGVRAEGLWIDMNEPSNFGVVDFRKLF